MTILDALPVQKGGLTSVKKIIADIKQREEEVRIKRMEEEISNSRYKIVEPVKVSYF